ncbi:GLABROUS1 enhancer-binding protein-like [Lactuca sativa]|uniref:Glabrous enhancer-binding protein-like DBD domain-containing protein n=1 Tax=Lactuca sativa TaxID=4236 RepID=A0A9R1X1L8_LACSA|nr:GLABROUS1 enhancer-binding protein-like [Lactuca sativa]KAJ0194949.1 hypothetical protein LSAT_V11C700349700 [Lactuca sativa]
MAGSESEPANSSSGEEEEVSSEGSESESEPDKTSTPPPSSKKTQLTHNSSSDESGSESESDTDKPPEKPTIPDPSIKPIASKPMEDDQSKKPRSKIPTTRYSPPPLKSSTGKRPAAEGEPQDLKRVKKKTVVAVAAPDAGNGGEKKQLFQRLWSEDNEIELIEGMINYVNEKGKDPVADVNDFHDFVKKSLHVDVNNKQVIAKVRRLRKKYENNVARAENQSKKVRSFSNPHEKKMYELSKNLWGNDSNKNVVMSSTIKKVNVTPKPNKNRKSNVNGGGEPEPEPELEVTPKEVQPKVVQPLRSDHGSMGFMFTDEAIMNKGLELLSAPKKLEMEEKWKNLKVQELKHFLKKVELLKEQGEIVLNAMVKSGDN